MLCLCFNGTQLYLQIPLFYGLSMLACTAGCVGMALGTTYGSLQVCCVIFGAGAGEQFVSESRIEKECRFMGNMLNRKYSTVLSLCYSFRNQRFCYRILEIKVFECEEDAVWPTYICGIVKHRLLTALCTVAVLCIFHLCYNSPFITRGIMFSSCLPLLPSVRPSIRLPMWPSQPSVR